MRIVYQSGELYVSFTHAEVDHIVENRGKPAKMDIRWLKTLHEDISKCVMAHWSAVEVWDALESHQKTVKDTTKEKK